MIPEPELYPICVKIDEATTSLQVGPSKECSLRPAMLALDNFQFLARFQVVLMLLFGDHTLRITGLMWFRDRCGAGAFSCGLSLLIGREIFL